MSETAVLEPLASLALPPPNAPDAAQRRTAAPWPARVVDAVGAYLPLLVMALMALGSWWLVKNTPVAEGPRPTVAPRHEADYTLREFSVRRFTPEGSLQAQIEGDVLRHFPDNDTLEIDRPSVRAYGADGGVTVANARRALSNADATEVQLLGDAQVTRGPTATDEGLTFRGEFLHVYLKTEQLRSHLPVTVTRGGTFIRADTFSYDHLDRTVSLAGRVRATFAPTTGPKPAVPGAKPSAAP